MRRGFFMFFLVLAATAAFPAYSQDASRGDIILDAERVIFDQATGRAESEGRSILTQDNVRIFSHRMEYDTVDQFATATSLPGETVTLLYGNNRFTGKTLEYDLDAREGVLTDATGDLPAGTQGGTVFIRGKNLEVVPLNSALEKKWMKKMHARRAKDEDVQVARWSDASMTTCPMPKTHYRLTTKRLVVIPGVRVIAKNPRVYIAEKFLFSYPFDYVIPLHGEKDYVLGIFIPSLAYDSDKGLGYALEGPYAWDTGEVNIGLRYWSDIDLEARAGARQRLGRNLSAFARMEYTWEKLDEDEKGDAVGEKTHRPSWGFDYSLSGWNARVLWSQRENLDLEKRDQVIDGAQQTQNYRNVLHREPEVTLSSPWFTLGGVKDFSWRVTGVWGDYETSRVRRGEAPSGSRSVWDVQAQYIVKTGDVRPFWRGQYRKFSYSGYDDPTGRLQDHQEISSMWLGFRTRLGVFDFANAWHTQSATGRSPLGWDRAGDKEVFYTELGLPVGRDLYLSALSTYNIKTHEISEVVYRLILDHDCSRWEFIYRDDHLKKNDDWMSLRFMVKAFPETPLIFGDKRPTNPFPNQGEFRERGPKGVMSRRPVMEDDWGDDGLTYRSDPTELRDGEIIPAVSEDGDGEEGSGEDGNILNP
ncbi:MAG: hypothetical protein ACOYJV_03590 [Aminivibrio sp.]|jgi:hypothetical protein